MLVVLVSCALTVALVRLFLVLTGYPQIGNSTFHLAHALWGGLALLLAGVMALVVQNRGAAVIIALLSGIGFGLFVDEVGKFITQKNDYFFPLAAPIVYASLLLILLLTELARRHQLRSPRAHLLAVISLSQTIADGTATRTEITAMENHIRQARTGSLDDASAALLNGIETSMALTDRVEEPFAFVGRAVRRIRRAIASWLPTNRARRLARLTMAIFCILGLLQLLLLIGVAFTPEVLRRGLTLSVRDQPVGDEEQRPAERPVDHEGDQVGRGELARGEDVEGQHGGLDAPFPEDEGDQGDHPAEAGGQDHRRRPALGRAVGEGVDDPGQAGRGQRGPAPVEPPGGPRVAGLGHVAHRHPDHHRGQGQVD